LLDAGSALAQALRRGGPPPGLSLATIADVTAWQIQRNDDRLELTGRLDVADAPAIWRTLQRQASGARARLDLDLSRADAVDGAIMPLLVELRATLAARGVASELVGAPPALRPIVHLYGGDRPPLVRAQPVRRAMSVRAEAAISRLGQRMHDLIVFAGELSGALVRALRHPRSANPRHLPALVARAGSDGIPVVLVLNFLAGFVMAYQSTRQLELYGANIFVADVVGISLTRELAPLMTAIIIAGRSGAGYAAELGTMRVSEEIDALRTMGFDPLGHLVLPRVAALVIVAPLLTVIGMVVGVLGGLGVAAASLDLTPGAYLNELRTALVLSDVWTGLIKSIAFALAVAVIGCEQGLATRGAAAGVGRSTTTTVVLCLFAIVVLDTVFTMLFRIFDV
jgi:phospholipid/cholesterol/gamma-HCH transport system permease protein